jgi:putative transcriptional regulator
MIVYNKLRALMKEKGLTTYKIRKDNVISQRALASIIHDQSITMETVNKLCAALECQPGDILEYIPDQKTE